MATSESRKLDGNRYDVARTRDVSVTFVPVTCSSVARHAALLAEGSYDAASKVVQAVDVGGELTSTPFVHLVA